MAIEPISPVGMHMSPAHVARLSMEVEAKLHQSYLRISTGLRITSPAVDPAGLAQSMRFENELGRIDAAQSNMANALSFSATQQGALEGVGQAVERMGELSVRAQDMTMNAQDRASVQAEFSRLQEFVSDTTSLQFNGIDLFSPQDLKVTVDADANVATMKGADLAAPVGSGGLGNVLDGLSVATPTEAVLSSRTLETAVQNIATIRANIAAVSQHINVSGENLSVLAINLNEANGRVVGADLYKAAPEFAADKILADSALLAFTKANRFPRPGLSVLA